MGAVGAAVDLRMHGAVLVRTARGEDVSVSPDNGNGDDKREPLQNGQMPSMYML